MQTTGVDRASNEEREHIEVLVTREQKDLLEQAAARRGAPLAVFIGESLARTATEAVREGATIVLGVEDSAVFADALLNPPEPGPVLRAMARRHGLGRPFASLACKISGKRAERWALCLCATVSWRS